ncbi:hypothetical protein ACLOJK_036113 [Asimina triloba]
MASLQIARSPFLGFSQNSTLSFSFSDKRVLKLRRHPEFLNGRDCRVCCRIQDGENDAGEEAPESLFMKELKKRGITPASLLEESTRGRSGVGEKEMEKENGGGLPKRNAISTDYEKSLDNQRERSMALNSEGLEVDYSFHAPFLFPSSVHDLAWLKLASDNWIEGKGLIPRAKLLLTTGGTFFIGFWPLILITVGFFSALYVYFGSSFVHDGSKITTGPPPYIDPYRLLEDERLSDSAPNISESLIDEAKSGAAAIGRKKRQHPEQNGAGRQVKRRCMVNDWRAG